MNMNMELFTHTYKFNAKAPKYVVLYGGNYLANLKSNKLSAYISSFIMFDQKKMKYLFESSADQFTILFCKTPEH